MALWNKFVLNTHALRIWVVHLLVYSAPSQQVEHCLGSAGEHLTELYKYLENTAKKRIEFLIHKSWQIEQVIGKVRLILDWQLCFLLSCFLQTNVCIHVQSPSPKCRRLFTGLVWFDQVFIVSTQSPQAKTHPLVSRVPPKSFVTIGSSIFSLTSSSEAMVMLIAWLRFCRGGTIRTDCEGTSNLLYFL